MPKKTGADLQDPVGAITRMIKRVGSDFSFGKPSERDYVIRAEEILGLERDDDREERIAEVLWQDSGEKYYSAERMAAFIYAELTS